MTEQGRRGLRVCMVHCSDFHLDSRIQRQAYALADRGDEVDSVCLSPTGELKGKSGSIRLHAVRGRKPSGGARAYLTGYARFFTSALSHVSRLDRRRKFDLIEVHNMPNFLAFTALFPKLRGTPVVLNVHDTFPELFASMFDVSKNHPLVGVIKREERWSARFADAVITVTAEARERLGSRDVGKARTAVVMNSPDARVFGPARSVATPPPGEPLRIVYHGGLAPRFGVESLVRAAGVLRQSLPDVAVSIYGAVEDSEPIRALADEIAPDNVYVAPGPTPFERIPALIAEAHVGVVPTVADLFTELLLPVKLLEYVHMGLPVVASRLPAVERYFGDDTVRFYEPGSPQDLAAAIMDVRNRPEDATRRAERAAERLRDFEWPRQREQYLGLIDQLVVDRGEQLP